MKNKILIPLLMLPLFANAQWSGTTTITAASATAVGIGTSSPATKLEVVNSGLTTPYILSLSTFNSSNYYSGLRFNRSRATLASPSDVAANDLAMSLIGSARINAALRDIATINIGVGASPSSTSYPGYITFNTVASGTTALAERMRITESGWLGLGTTPATQFHVVANSAAVTGRIEAAGDFASALDLKGSGNWWQLNKATNASGGSFNIVYNNGSAAFSINPNGNVGIGTAPTASNKLEVLGNINATGSITTTSPIFAAYLTLNSPMIYTGTSGGELNKYVQITNSLATPTPAGLKAGGLLVADDFNYSTPSKNDLSVKGKIGIGMGTTALAYTLSVNGNIGAKDIQLTSTGWPDYVFATEYKLPTPYEVELFISKHKHLEGIPSAQEVAKDGYSVTELNQALLKKVEELTLYMIQQQKELDELKKKLEQK
jgi:hypothetical protein